MALEEGLVLGGSSVSPLQLNLLTGTFSLEALDLTPPAKRPEYAQSSDADGAVLIRTPLFENRTITATVRINPQTTMNKALEEIGKIVDRLQEAEKVTPVPLNAEGVFLEWTPSNATKFVVFWVLSGAVTGLPVKPDSGWFQQAPMLTVQFTCLPFGYGEPVEAAAAKANETGLSVAIVTLPNNVPGDVPAEGRLVVKDTAAVGRRFVEWGLEQRYYNASTSLILAAESMVTVGGTLSEAANTGAYKPGAGTKLTIATTLLGEPTICANTGNLKHIGTFRVKARIKAVVGGSGTPEKVRLRLSYQDGEGPLRANEWQRPVVAAAYSEVDLGTVTVTPALTGTQQWLGQVEAYSENVAAKDTLHINYLTFIPVLEGYGKALGVQSTAPGTIVAFDNLTSGTLSGSLNARVPATGAAWATSGATTDWTVEAGKVKRATAATETEPRFGVLGATLTNSTIVVTGAVELLAEAEVIEGAILRWGGTSANYAFAQAKWVPAPGNAFQVTAAIGVRVASATTILNEVSFQGRPRSPFTYQIVLTATADGALAAAVTVGEQTKKMASSHVALKTGEALATGLGGFYDENATNKAANRTMTSISVTQRPAIPYCIQPSRTMEVRSDATLRQDAAGAVTGNVPAYRGSQFFVPQRGAAGRTARIIVKADRNDLEEADQQTIGDAFTIQAFVVPRFHVVPR